jgi:hypothetical protein
MRIFYTYGFVILFLFGCHRVPTPSSYTIPDRDAPSSEIERCAYLRNERETELRSVRTLYRCTVEGDEKYRFRVAVTGERHSRIRIEQFPTNGFFTLGSLVRTNRGGRVLLSENRRVVRLSPDESGFEQLFGFELGIHDLEVLDIISALMPVSWNEQSGLRVFSASPSNGSQTELVYRGDSYLAYSDTQCRIVELHRFSAEDEELFGVSYEYDDQLLPRRIVISLPALPLILGCDAVARSWGEKLKDDLFSDSVPEGYGE